MTLTANQANLTPKSQASEITSYAYIVRRANTYTENQATFDVVREENPSREQWMAIADKSGVLDFWNDPEEDIYTPEDGRPL